MNTNEYDKNIVTIFEARKIIINGQKQNKIDELSKEACEQIGENHKGRYFAGRRLGVESRTTNNDMWIYVLCFFDSQNLPTEELLVFYDGEIVFSAEGHVPEDYITTFIFEHPEWLLNLHALHLILSNT